MPQEFTVGQIQACGVALCFARLYNVFFWGGGGGDGGGKVTPEYGALIL